MDPVGIGVAAAVLLVGTAGGLWRRRTSGRLREVPAAGPVSRAATPPATSPAVPSVPAVATSPDPEAVTSPAVPSAAPAATSPDPEAVTLPRTVDPARSDSDAPDGRSAAPGAGPRLDPALLASLGVEPGERATLLQFSSAFCAPCRALRRISAEVAEQLPGVRHVEVDAESHLDAVRALGIWRTPTLLVLDRDGRVTKRATGVPAKPQLIAALGEVI